MISPVAAILGIIALSQQSDLVEQTRTTYEVSRNNEALSRDVGVAVNRATEGALYAPTWGGIVTSIEVAQGDEIGSGDKILSIDGTFRLGHFAESPFYRPLGLAAQGADVASLHELLDIQGLPHSDSDTVTDETVEGIRQLAAQLNAPTEGSAVFDPAWVVYMPAESVTLGASQVSVAQLAPTQGSKIFGLAPQVTSAVLVDAADVSPVSRDQGDGGQDPDLEFPEVTATVTATAGERLLLAGTEFPLNEARDGIAAAALADVSAVVTPDSTAVPALLQSEAPDGSFLLPVSAVYTGVNNNQCVTVRERGVPDRPVRVSVVGDAQQAGIVTVQARLEAGTSVLVPGEDELGCGST